MARCTHTDQPLRPRTTTSGWRISLFLVVLALVVSYTLAVLPAHALGLPAAPPPRNPSGDEVCPGAEDLQRVLEHVDTIQRESRAFPDPLLKHAVEAALRPEASWTCAEVAMRAFDLYKDRPWATDVLTPFAIQHATQLLLNADAFATVHRDWTKRALTVAAAHAPTWVFRALTQLMAVDAPWAKQLVATVAARYPALAFTHAEGLLAVDRPWAHSLLQRAMQEAPQHAVSMLRAYVAEPWGPQLFTEAALAVPRWTVTVAAAQRPESQTVLAFLQHSPDPHLRLLAQIAQSDYSGDVAARVGGFVYDIVANQLPLDEAARLSTNDQTYFRALVDRKLANQAPQPRVVDDALQDQATIVFQYLNELFDKPDVLRFRMVEPLTARELYTLMAYGETNAISTSYHGVFTRFLARMRQEGLTGAQVLAQVHEVRLRPFVKAAAKFRRLEAFLATIAAAPERWAVVTRCFQGLERAPDMAVQAAYAAEIVDTTADGPGLPLLRDTLLSEYRRVERTQDPHGLAVYGLLVAQLVQRTGGLPDAPEFITIAQRYRPYLPDWRTIPLARLFQDGLNLQRYFFYNDEDGHGSFQSFLAQYRAAPAWHVEDYGPFVRLSAAVADKRIIIYANTPTDDGERATDLERLMQQHGMPPQVIVHRGHSPYVAETIARMPRTTALVYLGNCGGYTLLDSVFHQAPEAQVITTIGVGTITVNDPFLKELNEYLLRGTEGSWVAFWQRAAARLGHNPRFADYVAPDHNAGALFLRAYRGFIDHLHMDEGPRSAGRNVG
jgi:hypothetical protein